MKHPILIALIAVLLMGAIFYKDIYATGIWLYLSTTYDIPAAAYVIPEDTQTWESDNSTEFEFLTLETLNVPVIFTSEVEIIHQSTSTLAVSGLVENQPGNFIVLSQNLNFIYNEEYREACNGVHLEKSCESNYAFFKATMDSSPDKVGFFSSRQQKLSQLILPILKSTFLRNGTTTITPFETLGGKGFYVKNANDFNTIHFFDTNDTYYEFILSNISDEQTRKLVANMK